MTDAAPKFADRLAGCAVLPPMPDDRPPKDGTTDPRAVDRSNTSTATATRTGKPDGGPSRERFETLNQFVDFAASKLNRSELLVWMTLYRDTRDGTARTGQADLARRTRLGARTVRWAIGRLKERGLLVVVHRGGLRRGPSTYRVRSLDNSTG